MKFTLKKMLTNLAIAASIISIPAHAAGEIYDFTFTGLFTMLTPNNTPVQNRTPITGTMHFDTTTGAGSGTLAPFIFFTNTSPMVFHSISFQAIGNGTGGAGSLVLGNMLFDWNGTSGIPVSVVMDAQGLFGAMQAAGGALTMGQTVDGTYGVLGASDGINNGTIKMGNLAMATTGWNTTLVGPACTGTPGGTCMGRNPSGGLPLIADSVGGSPILDGPTLGYSANFDVQSMKVTAVTTVPVPAAAWLLGSGMVGLFGLARRRNMPV